MSTKKGLQCIFYFHCFWVWYMDWIIFLDGFHEERAWSFCTWRKGWRESCRTREDSHSFDNLILEVTSHHFCHTVFVRIHSRNATHTEGGGITRRWRSLSPFLEDACNGLPSGSQWFMFPTCKICLPPPQAPQFVIPLQHELKGQTLVL